MSLTRYQCDACPSCCPINPLCELAGIHGGSTHLLPAQCFLWSATLLSLLSPATPAQPSTPGKDSLLGWTLLTCYQRNAGLLGSKDSDRELGGGGQGGAQLTL
jgi:hypothetical protein